MVISTRPPHIRELARLLGINASSVFRYVRRNDLKIDRAEGCCFLVDEKGFQALFFADDPLR